MPFGPSPPSPQAIGIPAPQTRPSAYNHNLSMSQQQILNDLWSNPVNSHLSHSERLERQNNYYQQWGTIITLQEEAPLPNSAPTLPPIVAPIDDPMNFLISSLPDPFYTSNTPTPAPTPIPTDNKKYKYIAGGLIITFFIFSKK